MSRKTSKYRVRFHRGVKFRLAVQERAVQNRLQDVQFQNIDKPVFSSNSSDNDEFVQKSMEKIQEWSIKHNITQRALSELLKILSTFGVSWLPSDARTVMKTPQNVELVDSANGKIWYCGLRNNIKRIFEFVDKDLELLLNFNIDGIPLYNSSKKEFWPILANFHSKYIITHHKSAILAFTNRVGNVL